MSKHGYDSGRLNLPFVGLCSFGKYPYQPDWDAINADFAILGAPFDFGTQFRAGARFGPRGIREASTLFSFGHAGAYDHEDDVTYMENDRVRIVDIGDADIIHTDTVASHANIEAGVRAILAAGAVPVVLGGDHSVSYPLLKAHAKKYGPVALVQFDAHCDTWPDDGSRLDHGTMFARAAAEGIIDVAASTQVGLRTYNDSDHGFEILTSPWIHRNGIDAAIDIVCQRARGKPVYLSFDIDGLDPAFAPGTGTPVVGGLASWQGLELIRGLEPLQLIGMDVVEVAPAYDHAEITAIAAASMAFDWIAVMAKKRGAKPSPVGRL